ncbi:peptidoglycan DD-metalloendopeptidase family protein [Paenibacillus typhae]|uniref:Murein DD-endopeptidase MepM and murein hydrolase activator NlpD, contain LysM domain n=1 Tax=Paenibacillus typhae TaxID=1174501 RepID=A0A1G9FQC4_9BACL|nr:peptidoglycan DD-metalloendopeptidase family protein [Paenibacillus typhae]SDK90579.1 Murein DD-endopeptidase MepM and murein hydrolase activator NlpD, contain LysM domain [Paenibacillus typhae]
MKAQHKDNRITLLVVREAGRPVRQLQLSKPLALALPAAAALSISSLVTSMHFHASRSIAELEAEAASLSLANLRMEMKVADKDQTLQQLRSQVTELSEEAELIKDKLKSVSELEAELQSLIDSEEATGTDSDAAQDSASISGNPPASASGNAFAVTSAGPSAGYRAAALNAGPQVSPAAAVASLPAISFRLGAISGAISSTVTPQVGGEYIAVYQDDPLGMVQETRDDYEEIRSLLDEMLASLSTTITEAKEVRDAEAQLKASQALAEKARLAPAVIWPTRSKVITSSFGYRSDPFKGISAYHSGIDIAGSIGDPIYAAMEGEVTASDQMGARGKYIIIKHANGLETWYMHLNSMTVSAGDKVSKGEQIGTLGNTGRSTGPHLHFQVIKQNKAVNPLGYVKP